MKGCLYFANSRVRYPVSGFWVTGLKNRNIYRRYNAGLFLHDFIKCFAQYCFQYRGPRLYSCIYHQRNTIPVSKRGGLF